MKYHCAFDLDYLLNASKTEANRMLRDADGNPLSFDEVKARAAILKARGFAVMPIGCDNHDALGYCKGHGEEVKTNLYHLSLADLEDLSNALSEFDGMATSPRDKKLVSRCHQHIQRALGDDVAKLYVMDEATEGAAQ